MNIMAGIKIEEFITDLIGWKKGIDEMCEAHREVAPKKAIYELTEREDNKIKHRLRKIYLKYKEDSK